MSGNTEKIANKIAEVFAKHGWENHIVKVDDNFDDENCEIDFLNYDFVCMGSPVLWYTPYEKMLWPVRKLSHKHAYSKIIPGPKMGFAFTTYAGAHLGPKEADACLSILELTYEHLGYKSAGKIAIPGKHFKYNMKDWYFDDMKTRPNADDLLATEKMIEDIFASPEFVETYSCA